MSAWPRSLVHLACVAGLKSGRGNLGAVSRPNYLSLPFQTPATQALVNQTVLPSPKCLWHRRSKGGSRLTGSRRGLEAYAPPPPPLYCTDTFFLAKILTLYLKRMDPELDVWV